MNQLTSRRNRVASVHARLFVEDIAQLKKIADARGTKWHIELRLLVRRALSGEHRDVVILKE